MNKCLPGLLLLFFVTGSFGQNFSGLSYKWKKPRPFVEIPEEFKKEDAVAIYSSSGIKNTFDITSRINFYTSYYYKGKIRILTANGLKEYSNLSIRKRGSLTTVTLDARTIKKDGKTIPIKSEDIKLLRSYDDVQDVYFYEYRIAVPGVEIGDEIEFIYSASRDGLSLAGDVYLYGEIACLESSFDLTLKKGLVTASYCINNMVAPVVNDDTESETLTWTLKNIGPVKNQNFSIPDQEFPYLQYKINKLVLPQFNINEDVAIVNWGELNKVYAREDYDNSNNKSHGLENYFSSFKETLDTLKIPDKVRFFVNKINNDFTIMDDDDDENAIRPVMYFIENKKIDRTNLRLFYKYMFYYLKIPFESCYGKSRYAGDLFPDIISEHQITHSFFSFTDEMQSRHYLFRSFSDFKYNVDERPPSLENTKVIFLKKQDLFAKDAPAVQISSMSSLPAEGNVNSVSCSYHVNDDWSSSSCDMKVQFKGMTSLQYRTEWIDQLKYYKKDDLVKWLDQEDNKRFGLDTVFIEQKENAPPFKFGGRVKSKESDVIESAGDNVSSLKIQIPFSHQTIPVFSYNRITDLYVPCLYTDELVYFIKFPTGVTIINEQDLVKNVSNEAGRFTVSVVKIDDTTFKISSVYKIKSRKIEKLKYKMLVDLNDAVEQSKELNILFKKL